MQDKTVLENSVQFVKGVGPKRYQALNRLGIFRIRDLFYFFPKRYEDRTQFTSISRLSLGKTETLKGKIITSQLRRSRKGLPILEVAISDGTGTILAVWFNQPYLKNILKVGQELILYGKVERFYSLQINSPEFEIVPDESGVRSLNMGRIVPIYPLTRELTQKSIRSIINEAIRNWVHYSSELLPYDIRSRQDLPNIVEAIKNLHFPEDFTGLEKARRRFVFEEFFLLQLGILLRKIKRRIFLPGISHQIQDNLMQEFSKRLPFTLTQSQKRVIREIQRDMARPRPMNRLLQGEVGSGKTVVACYALLLTVGNGYQGALMVPTEILAEQHYLNLSRFFLEFGINVGLLISSIPAQMKDKLKEEIRQGEIDIIIGTHSLIEEDVEFKKLGLVVIDEQHKFGVLQRKRLKEKGLNPDTLIMTATPIPRTLALTLYGELDISSLYELPKGRRPIRTFWVNEARGADVYRFVAEQVRLGRQAFIVFPLIEESENLQLKAARVMYEKIRKEIFPQFRVGLLHGRLSGQEKEKIMHDFKERKLDILVSTVIIEVGIDIPNASVMVIEEADRFGLAQLHQLRGRIGRGEHPSYCILISDASSEEARARLSALVQTQDGFQIAQQDLVIRGPGEFLGTQQHGLPQIKIGDIISDMKILEQARWEAYNLLKRDPLLNDSKHSLILENLRSRFPNLELISIG